MLKYGLMLWNHFLECLIFFLSLNKATQYFPQQINFKSNPSQQKPSMCSARHVSKCQTYVWAFGLVFCCSVKTHSIIRNTFNEFFSVCGPYMGERAEEDWWGVGRTIGHSFPGGTPGSLASHRV